jgi:(1->4)-alpha-D-glucan 1-alpha-D-glucosylmutase
MTPYPIATYRLQLHSKFGFKETAEIIEYLKKLGISHIYTSPFLQAVKDSSHGYDIIDPGKINEQIGTEKEFESLCKNGLGILLDIVPNHMAIAGNPWWSDILKNCKTSPYASYFDINWEHKGAPKPNDLGYRRFFDISGLAGLRIEDENVFNTVLKLPLEWYSRGLVQGFRVDHPDGLRNPKEFFDRLRVACPGAWIIAEKILEPGETLPDDWPVDGTTGYEFIHLLNHLFLYPEGQKPLNQIYEKFTGIHEDFSRVVYQSKLDVIQNSFQSEMHWLTDIFKKYKSEFMETELIQCLTTIAACFPVYRAFDEATTLSAIDDSKNRRPDLDPKLFSFLKDILTSDSDLAIRFQQFTGPVMAKGFEDTALYRYNRLVSLNEVGGNPAQFGLSLKSFHEACEKAQVKYPFSLLASSTHDTKHSEDFRARLNLLAEIPEEFAKNLHAWAHQNKKYESPDSNTEYLFYQILIGAWPIELPRVLKYLEKATREAKQHTSWNPINMDYESKVAAFASAVMNDKSFIAELEKFVNTLLIPGRITSLSATLIKLTAPGVPDIYQGSELWDLSLVDPDNRRPVDFEERKTLLKESNAGEPKLFIIQKVLNFRKTNPETFTTGSYQPLYATGSKKDHIVAFIRNDSAITIVPRFLIELDNDWSDTSITLPKGSWTNLFTQEEFEGTISVKSLFLKFPVTLLES